MTPKNLTKWDIEDVFARLDEAAEGEVASHMTFVVIGSAIVIKDGMPERSTGDVDFWNTTEHDRGVLGRMAQKIGIDINPTDPNRAEPYLQWISPEFVHMPLDESWQSHLEEMWSGRFITIARPLALFWEASWPQAATKT